jgi:hypothetical protein
LGDVELVNKEIDNYLSVTVDEIMQESRVVFVESNCSVLSYKMKENESK